MRKAKYNTTSLVWGTTRNKIVTIVKVFFRNGEHHAIVREDGKKRELPYIFLTELK